MIAGMCTYIVFKLGAETSLPFPVLIVIALLIGAAAGCINGFFIVKCKFNIGQVLRHPPLAVLHLDHVVLDPVIGEIAVLQLLFEGRAVAGDLTAVGPVLDFAGEDDLDLLLVHDDGDAVLLAGLEGDLDELLGQFLAARGHGHDGGDRLSRDDGVVLVAIGKSGNSLPLGVFIDLGRQVFGDEGNGDDFLELDRLDLGAGVVLDSDDETAQTMLEDHRHGVGAREDVLLDGGNEVGGGGTLGLVRLDGEPGREGLGVVVRIIGLERALLGALVIPVEVAGERGSVVRERLVGGVIARGADDGQADPVALFEIGLGGAGDHRLHADGVLGEIDRLRAVDVLVLVAGGQRKEGHSCADHVLFHDSICLKFVTYFK